MNDKPAILTRADLQDRLDRLSIAYEAHEHPPLFTVEQSQALRGTIAGAHTKNLFLRDRKDRLFLLTVHEDAAVDLKTVHLAIGASGKVSFGKAETLEQALGVLPGAVTPLGAVNDHDGRVTVVIDEALMGEDVVNAHPLTNEATLSLAPDDLVRFLRETGHEPLILKIAAR